MRWKVLALASACAILFNTATAQAALHEPNDTIFQAVGPLVGGQDYDGAIETSNDVDYFYFNVAGQRQIDITLWGTASSGGACPSISVLDAGGKDTNLSKQSCLASHVTMTTSASTQYVLLVRGLEGTTYRFRVDPADAIVQSSPGIVVTLGPGSQPDDIQRFFLDGNLAGTVQGTSSQSFSLGALAPTSALTFEAQNQSGSWSWNFDVTNHTDRTLTRVLSEYQRGGSSDKPAVGVVRRVAITPTGGVLSSCGQALASVSCIDNDQDGSPLGIDCNDGDGAIRPGGVEVRDNAIDENCDGVAARRVAATTTVSIVRRGNTTYRARIGSSHPECVPGRKVTLREKGKVHGLGSATAGATGVVSIRLAKARRGLFFTSTPAVVTANARCAAARSRTILSRVNRRRHHRKPRAQRVGR